MEKPKYLDVRMYNVGFGDCFLLSFYYSEEDKRHILIDFGSTALPHNHLKSHMRMIARTIRDHCENKLHIVIASHRHKDHISGFATNKNGTGPGDIIASCNPEIVIQPWTEHPDAQPDATNPFGFSKLQRSFVQSLHHVQTCASNNIKGLTDSHEKLLFSERHSDKIKFLGETNIANRSAVENLMTMGIKDHRYVNYGSKLSIKQELPGVNVTVLGPPSLNQSKKVKKQRKEDNDEFWHLQACTKLFASDKRRKLFPKAETYDIRHRPMETRWLVKRLLKIHGRQLFEIVRIMDKALNNTSVILLFEVGSKHKLLFSGDAQIENWQYALKEAGNKNKNKALLKKVTLYKVGHHGSLNATPKTLWELFKYRESDENASLRLITLLSTKSGKHGHAQDGTEVPRGPLVDALKNESKLIRSDRIKKKELFKTERIYF